MLIIENKIQGVIHSTSEGYCNWVEFGRFLFKLLNINIEINKIESHYFNKNLYKPKFSVLENTVQKTNDINIISNWKIAL